MSVFRALMCRLSLHRKLIVIQTFGAAQHIGCPDCGREMAIHHGMRAVLLWNSEIASLYQDMGYDTESPSRQWRNRP